MRTEGGQNASKMDTALELLTRVGDLEGISRFGVENFTPESGDKRTIPPEVH